MNTSTSDQNLTWNGSPGSANRRRSFRVTAGTLGVRAWRMNAYDRLIDRPLPSRRLPLSAIDMGRGGLAATIPSVCLLHCGDRIRLHMPIDSHNPDEVLIAEGRVVYVNALREEECRVGLHFQPALSETLARRFDNTLDHLLASLQRDELRRLRNAAA